MESIAKHLKLPKPAPEEDRTTERGEAVQQFLDRINPGRESLKLKALTFGAVAKLLKAYGCRDVADIYVFYGKCEEFEVFSKGFWFLIKQRKNEKKL